MQNKLLVVYFRVAALVFLGVLIFMTAFYMLGERQYIFTKVVHVKTIVKDVKGVNPGAKVMFHGMDVGRVKNITILSDTAVVIDMIITKRRSTYIYRDAYTQVVQNGLMGSQMVSITNTQSKTGHIRDNDILISQSSSDIRKEIEKYNQSMQSAKKLIQGFNGMLGQIDTSGGILSIFGKRKYVDDINRGTDQFILSLKKFNQSMDAAANGNGKWATLVNSDKNTTAILASMQKFDNKVEGINKQVANFSGQVADIKKKPGTLHTMLYNDTALNKADTALTKFNATVRNINKKAKLIDVIF